MYLFFAKFITRGLRLVLTLALLAPLAAAQQGAGALRGQVKDEFGAVIVGATVTLSDAGGAQNSAVTNDEGAYVFNNLAPGKYTLRAAATGFAVFEDTEVQIAAGRREVLDISLAVALEREEVTVAAEQPLSTEAENNQSALVIRGADLDALPDDPDDLAAALQALAGPAAGPNGGQIYIDGFTGGRVPPRESIREIRINQNPFSAEYDRLGFGRVEILTRPGSDSRYRGQGYFNFGDESLNSRNPYAPRRAPYQLRAYGGNLSGPVVKKKASFFLDFDRREMDDNTIINARLVDPATLAVTRVNETILSPRRFLTFSPRFDYQLNAKNTLVGRYTYSRSRAENLGVSEFSLAVDPFTGLDRTYDSRTTDQTFQVTETAVLTPTAINETRFQFQRTRTESGGDISAPVFVVRDAFTAGGSGAGPARATNTRWEVQNFTTLARGLHSLKLGARARGVDIEDFS